MDALKKFWNKIKWSLYEFSRKLTPNKRGKKKIGMSSRKTANYLFVFSVLAIPLIKFCVFWLYVNLDGLILAFQNEAEGQVYWTLENFKTIIESFISSNASGIFEAWQTTVYFQIYGIVLFPVGIFYMYFIFKKIRCYNFFRLMFYLPTIISSVVITSIFKYLINADGPVGVLYQIITRADRIPSFLAEKEYALTTVFIYQIWVGFSGNLLLFSGALQRIPNEIFESAALDGIGWFRELWQICVPLIWPTLSVVLISFATTFFMLSGDILLLTEGRAGTTTLAYWIFDQIKFKNSYYISSALGWVITVITIPIVLVVRRICDKLFSDVEF